MSTPNSFRNRALEGITIVLSILIAFGIDAAWDERNERREEQQLLQALLDEFEANRDELAFATAWSGDVRQAVVELLGQTALDVPTLSGDSLDRLISKAGSFNAGSTFQLSASDAVVLGGNLGLIRDDSLRTRLTDWNRDLGFVMNIESWDRESYATSWIPFLREHANLVQLNNAYQQPGGASTYQATIVPTRGPHTNHGPLLANPEFQNVLIERLWAQDDILYRYGELSPRIEEVVSLLQQELDR